MFWKLFGFGLTVGWLWLFFLSGPVFIATAKQWPGNPEYFFQFYLFITSMTYFSIGKWLKCASLTAMRPLLILSATLMSVCPGLIYLLPLTAPLYIKQFPWIIFILVAGGGISGTILLLAWMETFLAISFKAFGLLYGGGIIIASILLFGGAVLNTQIGILLTSLIPLITLLLVLRHHQISGDPQYNPKILSENPPKKVFPIKLILLIVLFYTAGGLMFKLVGVRYTFANFFWISNVSYLIVVVLAGLTISFLPDLDLRLLLRPVLPFLAAGFILLPFLPGKEMLSFILLQAGFALFDMYTWLLIVYIARGYSKALPVLGRGMFWITFSIFSGNLAFSLFSNLIPLNKQLDSLAIMAGLITILASLFFQEGKETFAGWETFGNQYVVSDTVTELFRLKPTNADITNTVIKEHFQTNKIIDGKHLTHRESEILYLILKGRNNPFIRESLNISPSTLKFHLRNLYGKFAVKNRQELISLLNKTE